MSPGKDAAWLPLTFKVGMRGSSATWLEPSLRFATEGVTLYAKGTATTDVYSLKGLLQALDRVGQECR